MHFKSFGSKEGFWTSFLHVRDTASRGKEKRRLQESQARHLVLVSHQFSHNDGQGRVNYEVALRALQRNYRVTILATQCAQELLQHPNATHVPVANGTLPTAMLRNLAFANSTARWLRKHRNGSDLVLANGFITWEPANVNVAHFVHTAWESNPSFPFKGLRPYSLYQRMYTALNARWEKPAFRNAQKVIAVSDVIAQEVQSLGVPAERIVTIPNGVDTEQFQPGAKERQSFGLPPECFLALFAGDIKVPRKNLETVLKAMQHVPELHLAVAGATEGSPSPDVARELGVADRVHFLGKVTEMAALMRSADLFVFPSRYEPFGLVVTEAMASGVPVIVSRCSGAADFVGDGGILLNDPNDFMRLAEVMNQLRVDADTRAKMSRAGRMRALQMQWSTMADAYLQVFEEVYRSLAVQLSGRK